MAVNAQSGPITYDITEHIGTIKVTPNGWTREVNIISWNVGPARLDIREWDKDRKKSSVGFTFSRSETEAMKKTFESTPVVLAGREPAGAVHIDDMRFDIVKPLCVLSTAPSGWTREMNVVSWNGGPEKLDIREWDRNHERMSKGLTFNQDESDKFIEMIRFLDINKIPGIKDIGKKSFVNFTPNQVVLARLPVNPEIKTVTTSHGEEKVCNFYVYVCVDASGNSTDNKKDPPIPVRAWGDIAEDLAANYKKGDTIQFLGKPIPVAYTPAGSTKEERLEQGFKIVFISHDKTIVKDTIQWQNEYLSERLTQSRNIRKGFDINKPDISKRL